MRGLAAGGLFRGPLMPKATVVTGASQDSSEATGGRFRHTDTEKEAGAAGGESGARSHGPALGGEAGPVLM